MGGKRGAFWIVLGALLVTAALFLQLRNVKQEQTGGRQSAQVLRQLQKTLPQKAAMQEKESIQMPEYCRFPEKEMPTVMIDGQAYIGVLEIPKISLRLPIHAQCSDALLRCAPCCYAGTAYQNGFVIAGHNYSSHFGALPQLTGGDSVYFTDTEGNAFSYRVAGFETLKPSQTEEMTNSGYALTLFTCTYGGTSRISIRCNRAD